MNTLPDHNRRRDLKLLSAYRNYPLQFYPMDSPTSGRDITSYISTDDITTAVFDTFPTVGKQLINSGGKLYCHTHLSFHFTIRAGPVEEQIAHIQH